MRTPKTLVLITTAVVAAVAAVATGIAMGVTALADGPSTTYYACLSKADLLYKVGTVSPTCGPKASVISWNSAGPQGPQGLTGNTGATGSPGPGAESSQPVPIPQPNGADVSLALAAGTYVATWDLGGAFTGGCGLGTSTNVTTIYSGTSAGLVTVESGGGTLTIHCAGNGSSGMAELTATPTTIE